MEMKGKRTVTQSISLLVEYLASSISSLHESNRLQYRFTAISSYYKDIGALVRKLKQYSTYLAHDRDRFISIENAFNALMEDLVPLRHGKQRYKYLTPSATIFMSFTLIDGLREHKSNQAPKLNWVDKRTELRFKEYLNLIENSERKTTNRNVKPLPPNIRLEEERQMEIAKFFANLKLPDSIQDIHKYIFDELSKHLDEKLLGLFVSQRRGKRSPLVKG